MSDLEGLLKDDVFMAKLEILFTVVIVAGFILNVPFVLEQREACLAARKACRRGFNLTNLNLTDNGTILDFETDYSVPGLIGERREEQEVMEYS